MKLSVVILSAFFLLSLNFASAQTVTFLFYCNGNKYTIQFSDKDLIKTPSWNPERDDNAPLSIRKALEIGRTTLNQCRPKANNNWTVWQIKLNPMGMGKWIYELEFVQPEAKSAEDRYQKLYIKLDGKVILPKSDAQPTEKLDTLSNPIPSN